MGEAKISVRTIFAEHYIFAEGILISLNNNILSLSNGIKATNNK